MTRPDALSPSPTPTVAWGGAEDGDPSTPLVVLLHGRGSNEQDIATLAEALPPGPTYAAVRAPIAEGGGYAWFHNRGIGRPLPESLAATTTWFRAWLDGVAPPPRRVLLVGFSGGATFAGGVVLADPSRFAGLATLYATLPFDAGVDTSPGRLTGTSVLVAQGDADTVIPVDLQQRTWAYLHDGSGAAVTALRSPGGHGLTRDDVLALSRWIVEVAALPRT